MKGSRDCTGLNSVLPSPKSIPFITLQLSKPKNRDKKKYMKDNFQVWTKLETKDLRQSHFSISEKPRGKHFIVCGSQIILTTKHSYISPTAGMLIWLLATVLDHQMFSSTFIRGSFQYVYAVASNDAACHQHRTGSSVLTLDSHKNPRHPHCLHLI